MMRRGRQVAAAFIAEPRVYIVANEFRGLGRENRLRVEEREKRRRRSNRITGLNALLQGQELIIICCCPFPANSYILRVKQSASAAAATCQSAVQ